MEITPQNALPKGVNLTFEKNEVIKENKEVTPEPKTDKTHDENHDKTADVKYCKHCNTPFKPYNIKHIFCSNKCRLQWHKKNDGFDIEKHISKKPTKKAN